MLNLNHFRLFLLFLALSLLLAGCAAKEQLPRFVWPPPPDEPRLEFVGNYSSEESFEKSAGQLFVKEMLGARGQATFATPFGIAADGKGVVYISDIHLHNVRIYDFNQKTVNFLTKNTQMGTPLGLELDSKGNLYIADAAAGKVLVYGPDHQPLKTFSYQEELVKPAYLAIDEKRGRLYVSDGVKHKIIVFSLAGDYLFSIGQHGGDSGMFYSPQGLAIGPDGNLYVADMFNARIQVLTPEGEFIRMFGERGDQPGQFENPKDLAFDSAGNLHVLEGRRSDLLTFTPEGRILLITGGGKPDTSPFGFGAPRSIAIDANDRIYIAEATNKRFTIWQYMGESYLAQKPYTAEDRKALIDYAAKLAAEREKAAK
jgi:sugar lactone lactonase YvrE